VFKRKNINKSKKITYIKAIIIIIFLILWITYKSYLNFKSDILNKQEKIISIKSWENIKSLAQKLDINSDFLKTYLKYNENDFKLIKWNFKISKDAWIEQILKDLKKPIIENEINITILEWWNIFDIDNYLSNKKLIKSWEYISYVESKEKIKKLSDFFPFIEWLNTLEWFLYPDTYKVISNNFKINVFVIKQLESFEKKVYEKLFLDKEWNKKYENNTIEDVVNLASIVEKEEKNIKEKSTVAGILKKRLNSWWMIWADITVCYPYRLTSNECKLVVSKYINEKSEYNTRKMKWLPKSPIWNPSFETIDATLNDKESSYWFYLHDIKTWKIYYARTNSEHERNKRLYLR
jgi:UPF0755 protein